MEAIVDVLYNLYFDDFLIFKKEINNLETYENSTSLEDCYFLYLLIRHIKPKSILEIGTYVGTTLFTIIKACEKNNNNFIIHTIDNQKMIKINNNLLNNVKIHNGWSSKVLSELDKNINFDFIFSDADIDKETSIELNKRINNKTFFATHDFVPPFDKGITSVFNIIKFTKLIDNYIIKPSYLCNWIYNKKTSFHDNFSKNYCNNNNLYNIKNAHNKEGINNCICIICPNDFIISLNLDMNIYNNDSFLARKYIYYLKLKFFKEYELTDNKLYINSKKDNILIVSEFIDKLPNIIAFIILI